MTKQSNEDPSSVEFWESLSIKPIVVDTSNDISSKAAEIAERIKESADDIKNGGKKE